jgi:hypothetical protein
VSPQFTSLHIGSSPVRLVKFSFLILLPCFTSCFSSHLSPPPSFSPSLPPASLSALPCPCPCFALPCLALPCLQVGSDIRQVLHAMQMWRAKSANMRYGELKDGMQRIEKDKVRAIKREGLKMSEATSCSRVGWLPVASASIGYNLFLSNPSYYSPFPTPLIPTDAREYSPRLSLRPLSLPSYASLPLSSPHAHTLKLFNPPFLPPERSGAAAESVRCVSADPLR